jgi:hypothetical protein
VRFKEQTKEVKSKIQEFKDKYNLNIIWRGLAYEWVKFYFLNLFLDN